MDGRDVEALLMLGKVNVLSVLQHAKQSERLRMDVPAAGQCLEDQEAIRPLAIRSERSRPPADDASATT
jgi:hypothetical protein